MKQRRLDHKEKGELFSKYETGGYTGTDLAKEYNISAVAINALLRRHGYKARSQSELQRKYPVDESFFDKIDTEQKAYILGLLYADGYNNTDRNAVALSLKESDKDILLKITGIIQPSKPLSFIKFNNKNWSNQFRMVVQNKHISKRLVELGCGKKKTFKIKFPMNNQVPECLLNHFVRGYWDGDGWIGKKEISVVGTLVFCNYLARLIKTNFGINCFMETRHQERKNNIRTLKISGGKQVRIFLKWMYKGSSIYMERKYMIYLQHLQYENSLGKIKRCSVDGCHKKHFGNGFCRNHHYEFCGGAEKRQIRYYNTGE